jgi:hypothetical protein
MLVGVTLLFTQAQLNGTLERVAHASVRICRGNTGLVPVMFFVLAAIIATLGPGNVATAAMLAPMAMGVGTRASIPPFLMAIMVGNGAQSGALSPLAPTGVIVTPLMEKIGLGGPRVADLCDEPRRPCDGRRSPGTRCSAGGVCSSRVSRRTGRERAKRVSRPCIGDDCDDRVRAAGGAVPRRQHRHGGVHGSRVLAALRVADHEQAIRRMPWSPILMLSGVSVLVALLDKTGGLDLFTDLLARLASPAR